MKPGLIAFTLVALALTGCATTSNDPYAANHAAPSATADRRPSSDDSCDSITPRCQLGDSYSDVRSPASTGGGCKQTMYECEKATVSCHGETGAEQVETLDYAPHVRDCGN